MISVTVTVRRRIGQASFARWRNAAGAERVEQTSAMPGATVNGWTCGPSWTGWKYDSPSGQLHAGDFFPGDSTDPMGLFFQSERRAIALMPGQFTLIGSVLLYDPTAQAFEV